MTIKGITDGGTITIIVWAMLGVEDVLIYLGLFEVLVGGGTLEFLCFSSNFYLFFPPLPTSFL